MKSWAGYKGEPPPPDTLEISVFGPGFGECIVCHLGHERWIVVDSCLSTNRRPVALEYLERLKVNPAEKVPLVVVSHWHDDHIRGISSVLSACSSAKLALSASLKSNEFGSLLTAYETALLLDSPGIGEMQRVLEILRARNEVPLFSSQDRLLINEVIGPGVSAEVWSLSPGDQAIRKSIQAFERLFPTGQGRRVPDVKPNHAAVALWLKVGEARALLGSDLEETKDPLEGWSAILDRSTARVGHACSFKIPHHGSGNAHQDRVWTECLVKNPLSLLTPYSRGRHPLPRPGDVKRISALTERAYVSRGPKGRKMTKNLPDPVARTLKQLGKQVWEPALCTGHIRARKPYDRGDWTIELIGDAVHLSAYEQ